MTTTVATDYDNIEIQQQYSDVNNRWDVDDWDNENSSARLFERSRIKALAGKHSSDENSVQITSAQCEFEVIREMERFAQFCC
ncbi:oxytocin-neurophysin 1 [Platysternon megacephalum]|uniref:Oxytocin-neurophysin 1 n=1 Tax=Platysternon megacephalum TaxID=55544 RepID=A0A4D9E167_9SAUR|nr:oxytocin-neurophysin 1 [Platysternon megacephalum]